MESPDAAQMPRAGARQLIGKARRTAHIGTLGTFAGLALRSLSDVDARLEPRRSADLRSTQGGTD